MERESVEGTSSRSDQVVEANQGREVFKRFPFKAKLREVSACAWEFRFPTDCLVYVPAESSHAAYPPSSFVAISPQHFESGFRFPLAPYLLKPLNELKLAPFQLTPNSYAQLTSLVLLFLRNNLPPPSPKLGKFLFLSRVPSTGCIILQLIPFSTKLFFPRGERRRSPMWATISLVGSFSPTLRFFFSKILTSH